jgi:hypothetical protein
MFASQRLTIFFIFLMPIVCLPALGRVATPSRESHAERNSSKPATPYSARNAEALPFRFETNVGQTDPRVKFLARRAGGAVFLTPGEIVCAFRADETGYGREQPKPGKASAPGGERRQYSVRFSLEGSDAQAAMIGGDPVAHRTNYLVGKDPKAWHTDVENFASVRCAGVYPGVDAYYSGERDALTARFVVAPNATLEQIVLRVDGAEEMRVGESGELNLRVGGRETRHAPPVVLEEGGTSKRPVPARYEVVGSNAVAFRLAARDSNKAVTIASTLDFSTYLGGLTGRSHSGTSGWDVAIDGSGAAYVTGGTTSVDFPVAQGAGQPLPGGNGDGFVAKLSPDGSQLVYATYLGGSNSELPDSIAVDSAGAAYVTGYTQSPDFPVTASSADPSYNGDDDVFVAKISPSGTAIAYATFLGGDGRDEVTGIAVDAAGAAFVAGWTEPRLETQSVSTFPTTIGAFDRTFNGNGDGFVTKIASNGTSFAYSTFLGSGSPEYCAGIAINSSGEAYVIGETSGFSGAAPFPTTPNAYNTTLGSGVFVTKLNQAGSALAYSTYIGNATPRDIAVGSDGSAYVTGGQATATYPTTPGAYNTTASGGVFVTKLNPPGSALSYSTFIGPGMAESIAISSAGKVFLGGWIFYVDGPNFPTTPGAYDQTPHFEYDGFVASLGETGSSLGYSTFLAGGASDFIHGLAVNGLGEVYVTGSSESPEWPTTPGAYDTVFNPPTPGSSTRQQNCFVTKFNAAGSALVYSTYVQGHTQQSVIDKATGIAADSNGALYVTGQTESVDFPTTPGTFDTTLGSVNDAFVSKLDPRTGALVYSTFLGGAASIDYANAIAVDSAGAAYVVGTTLSSDFPSTPGAYDPVRDDLDNDAFVTKLNPAGNGLVFSTFLGGTTYDVGWDIALGPDGSVYVCGESFPSVPTVPFPTTPGAYQTQSNGFGEGFVTRLNAAGSALIYSTLFGGTSGDAVYAIAVDDTGAAYITGMTDEVTPNTFPTTPNAFDQTPNGFRDAFVTKLTPTGNALVYSTFLGGMSNDFGYAIAVDSSGAAYVTGETIVSGFPTTPGAFQTETSGSPDGFVTKLDAAGSTLVYSTLLGSGSADVCRSIAVDEAGGAWVTGVTYSNAIEPFPVTPDAQNATGNGGDEAFVTRVGPSGSALTYSTLLGGAGYDEGTSIALGVTGEIFVAGWTYSYNFPTADATQPRRRGASDAFVSVLAGATLDVDSPGTYVAAAGAWFLRNSSSSGSADLAFSYGPPGAGLVPIVGDWNGDGTDTPGLYDPVASAFFLKDTATGGPANTTFVFGGANGGYIPLAGDWDGDGADSIGIYDPAHGVFFLKNTNGSGPADAAFTFGPAGGGIRPLAGDWDGDGSDSIGIYDPNGAAFFLKNASASGFADVVFVYGAPGMTPVVGDWNGDGIATVGVYSASNGAWFLRNAHASGGADVVFVYGAPASTPIAGDWNGS